MYSGKMALRHKRVFLGACLLGRFFAKKICEADCPLIRTNTVGMTSPPLRARATAANSTFHDEMEFPLYSVN